MKSAFKANVPKRKPKTRLGSMFAEIDQAVEEAAEAPQDEAPKPKKRAQKASTKRQAATKAPPAPQPEEPAEEEIALGHNPLQDAASETPTESFPLTAESTEAADTPEALDVAFDAAFAEPAEAQAAPKPQQTIPENRQTGPQNRQTGTEPRQEVQPAPQPVQQAVEEAAEDAALFAAVRAAPTNGASQAPHSVQAAEPQISSRPMPTELSRGSETVLTGRARIAELRAKLKATDRSIDPRPEPTTTADRVRSTIENMRGRLEEATSARTGLTKQLESTRQDLAMTKEALDLEQKARSAAEALANERKQVADGLIEEAELLAEERDRALAMISELKDLGREQNKLLLEMETSVEERSRALAEAITEADELRKALETAAINAETVHSTLERVNEEKVSLETQVHGLQRDLDRATNARTALTEIEKLVNKAL